ncbi:hypothetical protein [Extibacter muris]|uniref:hypothetical protein n=1 Tax=Extibacter muris TaxID=1796622 RepID=UPI001D097D0F|nr:hypothetical protein [Extibacter muris]MCB6200816.1 hypothetical protein [Extibacter muris]MCQ4662147.1 hypothetical protein [Extibacter muris]MCQ4691940.1 hypothetical protein [Extibacter muris]
MKRVAVVLCVLMMCLSLAACGNDSDEGGTDTAGYNSAEGEGNDSEEEVKEEKNTEDKDAKADNSVISGTSWTARDGSWMTFTDEENYAWYQDRTVTDDNYYAGTYEFYMGEDALKYLTGDLKEYGVTETEMQRVFDSNEEYSLDNLVCMTARNRSFMLDGAEQLKEEKEISYYGFMLQDGGYLDIANMTTGTYYGFTKE